MKLFQIPNLKFSKSMPYLMLALFLQILFFALLENLANFCWKLYMMYQAKRTWGFMIVWLEVRPLLLVEAVFSEAKIGCGALVPCHPCFIWLSIDAFFFFLTLQYCIGFAIDAFLKPFKSCRVSLLLLFSSNPHLLFKRVIDVVVERLYRQYI